MAELESELMQLREELLIEILVRLPVKSLIRCTCVCKHWLSLIRSPDFISKHHITRSKLFGSDCVLSLFEPVCSISIYSYQDFTFETAFKFRPALDSYDPPRFEIYHRDIISDCSIVGPCNGLFLIDLYKGVFQSRNHVLLLWNPATKEVFKLPKIPNYRGFGFYFGFGFDTTTHDYKVVGLYDAAGIIENTVVWVYSLATNSWTQIFDAYKHVTHFCYHTRVNVPVYLGYSCNGRMHNWILGDDLHCKRRGCLFSFDMVDQVFVETPLPSDAPNVQGFMYQGSNHMYPTVFRMLPNFDYELHVWDLQQGYGPTGVWNKLLNIKLPGVPDIKIPQLRGTPYVIMWHNKEILLRTLGTLSLYNLATQRMKSLGRIITYTESLVSIARSVGQPLPPPPPPAMDESVPLQLGDKGPVDDQQDLSEITTMMQQMLPKEDDDDDDSDSDDSSTDSAFLTPEITAFTNGMTVYIDYETDLEFYPHRKNEVERLSNLPYCLREINKPMILNPCTF